MLERYLLGVTDPTVIAIDWSGARRAKGIWLAVVQDGRVVESRALSTREEAIGYVGDFPAPLIAGFDFSFGMPEWFSREHGCASIDEVWALAARDGDGWLAPTSPFWRDRCGVPRHQRFRTCEERYPGAKSIFQLVGNGQVGAGSVRGMSLLPRLRAAGLAIWPFDDPADRTVVEIYPTRLRRHAPHHDAPHHDGASWRNNHERDAVVSARVMWCARETVAALRAATDPTTRLEGDIWAPTAST
jgi:hypothetical protein